MTKDELQKEAYEWTEKNISVGISMYNPSIEMYCGKAYKDGAEPREKQIEIDAKQIRALQKQNGELTDKVQKLEKENAKLRKTNTEVKKSIIYCNRVYNDNLDYSHHIEGQLTKAKEIIREFVDWATWQGNSKCPSFKSIQDKAEQFIKEIK